MVHEKLIISATTSKSWIYPNLKNWAQTTEELIEDVVKCYEAGAAIAHVHLPRGEEVEMVKRIRERCDVIIQAGKSSESIEKREGVFKAKPDIISILLNHHAKYFPELSVDVLHPISELEAYSFKCKEASIKPEWGIYHMGSYWSLNYLIEKGFLEGMSPHFLTLFFNWPGSTWSPPTYDEYMHRKKYMPDDCVHSVSAMGEDQMKLLVFVLTHGGNIRVGTKDYPFIAKGKPARDNTEIVKEYVSLAKHVKREVADPSEARKLLNIQ